MIKHSTHSFVFLNMSTCAHHVLSKGETLLKVSLFSTLYFILNKTHYFFKFISHGNKKSVEVGNESTVVEQVNKNISNFR